MLPGQNRSTGSGDEVTASAGFDLQQSWVQTEQKLPSPTVTWQQVHVYEEVQLLLADFSLMLDFLL